MQAINHALTGSLIGLTIGEPAVALPVAVVSHFACDALPHFGFDQPELKKLRSNWFRNVLVIDGALCLCLVLALAVFRPEHWLLACFCAFAAAAPDGLSFKRFRAARQHQPWRPGVYARFAQRIQWFERPAGAVVEVAWFTGAVILLLPFLR